MKLDGGRFKSGGYITRWGPCYGAKPPEKIVMAAELWDDGVVCWIGFDGEEADIAEHFRLNPRVKTLTILGGKSYAP